MTGTKAKPGHILPPDIPDYVVNRLTEENKAIDMVISLLQSQRVENDQRMVRIEKAKREAGGR